MGGRNMPVTAKAVKTLAREIRAERYTPDQPMPSENNLCERFKVSRMTVRVILAKLEQEGLIYRKQGKGTFVRPHATALSVALWLRDPAKASSPYLAQLMAGVDGELAKSGGHLSITSTSFPEWAPALRRNLAGVIIIPYNVTNDDVASLDALGIAHVAVMESDLPGPFIGMDPRGAAAALVCGLLARGHRRFAIISGHGQHTDQQKRLGIADALANAGISMASIPDFETNYEHGPAAAAASEVLRLKPTAVIAFDDTLALQFITTAQNAGVRVPQDISVTGFNDSPFSSLISPKLSTIRFPVREAGKTAAALLLASCTGDTPVRSVFLGHDVVWRKSVGKARGSAAKPQPTKTKKTP